MIDAHNHLQDARLDPWRAEILRELPAMGLRRAVVNGTREVDWLAVAALAGEVAWVKPSFGLHPWYVKERTEDWQETLAAQLDAHPGCGVGEIGLDRWIDGYDWPAQIECFTAQLALAAERNLPATIHCLQAWGPLWEILREHRVAERGFLVHAYGGSAEMAEQLTGRGAFFSFSTSFLHERKAERRAIFAAMPAERLLVETDAPDMAPPAGNWDLADAAGRPINHPANIEHAYAGLAKVRGMSVPDLTELVAANFARLFRDERPAGGHACRRG